MARTVEQRDAARHPAAVTDERPAREKLRRAVDALATSDDPLRGRVTAAEKPFAELDARTELQGDGEWNLYQRIASTLVSGGENDGGSVDADEGLTASIAALGEEQLVLIARDMLRLYELVGSAPDLTARWPPDWPVA